MTEKEAHNVKKLLEQKDSQCALKIQEEVEKAKAEWRQTLIGKIHTYVMAYGYTLLAMLSLL